jgi:hypothetical protein
MLLEILGVFFSEYREKLKISGKGALPWLVRHGLFGSGCEFTAA